MGFKEITENRFFIHSAIFYHEKGIKIHFFRKFKQTEGIPQDYIYIGDGVVFKNTVPKELVNPVFMDFAIHELSAQMYTDFITKSDITNVE